MEVEYGEEVDTTTPRSPFWLQSSTTNTTRIQRSLSSLFFNSFVLIMCLLVFAVASMVYIIIPSIIIHHSSSSSSAHDDDDDHMIIFKPNYYMFKTSSWDSINLLLVFIALLFGFLARNINNDDENMKSLDNPSDPAGAPINSPEKLVPHQWYDLNDQDFKSNNGLRRQRTSSSYPDLRELSPPWNHSDAAVDPWRFPDDTHLNYYQVSESNRNYLRHRSRRYQPSGIQENLSTPSFPPLPEQPAHAVKKKSRRVHHSVGLEGGSGTGSPEVDSLEKKVGRGERKRGTTGEKTRARSSEPSRVLSPVIGLLTEPSSPPPVSPLIERKRNSGNATKDLFSSFYHKKKNKLQRRRSVDNLGALISPNSRPLAPSPSLPSSSDINNLIQFKKENKKKFLSVTFGPPTPPPPPPNANRAPRPSVTRVAPFVTDRPKVPLMFTGLLNGIIDDSSSGGESPMKNIPPPPPLPPFKMPDWKFAVEGDFVRFQSTLSSRSVSPDGEEARSPSSDMDATATTTALTPPLFCPSPDVDTKADSFIARFRAGLKLERMSKLGPGADLDPNAS
uniref:serine/arginine repetitive matrix protein 1-like n=1 Tax=Erigeron canadensis TaxID=72917 RepID=UPI001CB9C5E1|nr:serine/arginine repetitive matrix protein 1-like [Erigeron canadensis]